MTSSKPRTSLQVFMRRLTHLYTDLDLLTGTSTFTETENPLTGIYQIDTEDMRKQEQIPTLPMKAIEESHVVDQTVNKLPQTKYQILVNPLLTISLLYFLILMASSFSKPRMSLQVFMSRLTHLYTALDQLTGISTFTDTENPLTKISQIETEDTRKQKEIPTLLMNAIEESHVEDQTVTKLPQTKYQILDNSFLTINLLCFLILMASSFSKPRTSFQVFISFRGPDVRNNFVEHLYTALDLLPGILLYRDAEALTKGSQVSPSLFMKAIEESRVAIIIFSENFASSKWCLDELVKIMECKEQRHLTVFPVYYRVKSSEVRRQTEGYRKAMVKHESKFGKNSEEVKKWKKALADASSLHGWELDGGTSEAKTIKDITRMISELKMHYDVFLNFRGKDVRENFVKSLHEALVQKGIRTFMDSEDLEKGQDFPPKLKEAIEKSRTYVIIFSENYAESWWCLKELVQILGEKNGTKQRLPIFYKVAPGEVRGHNPREVSGKKQSYEKALTDHESEFGGRKVKKWKEALSKAANLNGMHLHDGNMDGCIPRIVEEIEKMMQRIG